MFTSSRGNLLVLSKRPLDRPVITVELYSKWYGLYLVYPEGSIEEIPFPESEGRLDVSDYVDHVPNPKVVVWFAEKNNFYLDELALELIVGRWELEVTHHYDDLAPGVEYI